MEAQFEALSELAKSGEKLNFGQDFFVKFYQAFLYSDRWQQYIKGVGTTLLVTAIALVLGVLLGAIVAMIRVGHAQQKPHHRNPILGVLNAVCKVYVTVIRGTPMMVQLLIMSMVIFASSRNFTMVGALALGINSGAYVSEIIRGGLMAVDPGQMEAGRSLGLNYMTTMFEIIIPQAIRSILPVPGQRVHHAAEGLFPDYRHRRQRAVVRGPGHHEPHLRAYVPAAGRCGCVPGAGHAVQRIAGKI